MRKKLEKDKLKKEGHVKYDSNNPSVKLAEIAIFDYNGKKLYQPHVITNDGHYNVNHVGYNSIEEAKKAIDAFSGGEVKNIC